MPRIRPGMRKPPPGFDRIAAQLDEFEEQMKEAVQAPSQGVFGPSSHAGRQNARSHKRPREEEVEESEKEESEQAVPPLWRVAEINRRRTRLVYDAFYREKTISKEVFDYCCEMQFIDGGLARRWRLLGYERLCCVTCGVPGEASSAAQLTASLALRDKAGRRRKQQGEEAGQSTCLCRVPAGQRRTKHFEMCQVCGCTGCSSSSA